MNLSARSLFGLWTWHISIQYSRITVLAYKTSHFFFYGFVLHFEIRTEFPMCFSVFFRPVIGTKTSRLKSTEKNRTDRKMTMEKWTPRKPNHSSDRWHRTTLFWEKHMKHPHPIFFLNQHQIILPCSTFKISILYCEEQMLYGDERLHYLHRWDYCCLCMTSAHFFVITNEFVLLVKVCSRWGHVIYFCTVT